MTKKINLFKRKGICFICGLHNDLSNKTKVTPCNFCIGNIKDGTLPITKVELYLNKRQQQILNSALGNFLKTTQSSLDIKYTEKLITELGGSILY